MKKLLVFAALALVAFLYRHQIEAYFGGSKVIDLTDLKAEIPADKKHPLALTLKRGAFTYVFYKKADLPERPFRVVAVDVVSIDPGHKVWPEEAYARIIEVVAMDNEAAARAVRAMAGTSRDTPPADPADVKELESAKFTVGILPVKKLARDAARGILKSGGVQITGTHYELSEVTENGTQVPLKGTPAVRHLFLAEEVLPL